MDGSRFDSLLRALATTPSRRSAIRLAAAPILGGLVVHDVLPTEAKKKKKLTLCHSGQALTVSKKAKKKHLKHGDTLGSCAGSPPPPPSDTTTTPPPTGGCPSGQKPCDGSCIPDGQCCDLADCPVSGQLCTSARQCACPPALPDVCGGACLASCPTAQSRKADCTCCRWNGYPDGGSFVNCCSFSSANGTCVASPVGGQCDMHEGCILLNCVHGTCSSCSQTSDSCKSSLTCGNGGQCLKATDGTTRCGVRLNSFECNFCSGDAECDQGQGLGYFCAMDTGANCSCATGQTFCARPA